MLPNILYYLRLAHISSYFHFSHFLKLNFIFLTTDFTFYLIFHYYLSNWAIKLMDGILICYKMVLHLKVLIK